MEINKDNLHHAYLFVGTRESARAGFELFLETIGLSQINNPDLFLFENEVFGIDDARRLSTLVSRKAFGARKVFFVTPERLTLEAQNALLKTLEEPTPDTHILITLRERELLIPTLLSRMQVIEVGKLSEEKEEGPIKFIGMSLTDRLAFAREFADKGFSLPVFLDNLLVLLRAKDSDGNKLRKILAVRRFADGTSVSARLILEHLSFVV